MRKNIKLPFTNKLKGGSKDSFKILNNEQINTKIKTNPSLINYIKKFISQPEKNSDLNKVNYIKASDTKLYYKNLH